jgi:predicted transposase YbfD/YdcC
LYKRNVIKISRFIYKTLKELNIKSLTDPRKKKGKRWPMPSIFNATLLGIASGQKSLKEVESLTDALLLTSKKLLSIKKRLPDTTLRDFFMKLGVDNVRTLIWRSVHQMRKKKALKPIGLPINVVAMDGKVTALRMKDDNITQKNGTQNLMRTVTSTLTSAASKPVLDTYPIPPTTNEMATFVPAFNGLLKVYGTKLFDLVTYDAGANSLFNATWVSKNDKSYLFSLKGDQSKLHALAENYLHNDLCRKKVHEHDEKRGGNIVISTTYTCSSQSLLKACGEWREHLTQMIMVERTVLDKDGNLISMGNRYYVTNINLDTLTGEQLYRVIRGHWNVENNCHCVWDKSFKEDERHWIEAPHGNLVVLLLRRLVYNMLGYYRIRTQRSEKKRAIPWKDLMQQIYVFLLQLDAMIYKSAISKSAQPASVP